VLNLFKHKPKPIDKKQLIEDCYRYLDFDLVFVGDTSKFNLGDFISCNDQKAKILIISYQFLGVVKIK
jgi:hypothetical protein